jgi:hypothetical protein
VPIACERLPHRQQQGHRPQCLAELAPQMAGKFVLRLLDVALNLPENFVHGEFALNVRLGV